MAVQMTELDHIPGEELTHIPGEELTHIPGEELTHEPGLPLGYAPKWLLDELGLGHYYDPALTVDLNPLPPTVPHAPKTLPDPPPKKSQLPVPIVEHPNVKSQLPVPIEEPLAVASHLPVPLPEPATKKSQLPVAMPGVVGTEAERRAIGAPPKPRVSKSAARAREVEKKAIPTKPRSQKVSPPEPSKVVSRLPVSSPEPEVTKSHLPVPLPEPAAKKSQLPVGMPGVEGTEAARRAVDSSPARALRKAQDLGPPTRPPKSIFPPMSTPPPPVPPLGPTLPSSQSTLPKPRAYEYPPNVTHPEIEIPALAPAQPPPAPYGASFPFPDVLEVDSDNDHIPVEPGVRDAPRPIVDDTPTAPYWTASQQAFHELISNPQMGIQNFPTSTEAMIDSVGWFRPFASGEPVPTQTHYTRFYWSEISPAPGKYDFSVIHHVLNVVAKKRRRLSFRIMPFWTGLNASQARVLRNERFGFYNSLSDEELRLFGAWPKWARDYRAGRRSPVEDIPCFSTPWTWGENEGLPLPFVSRGYLIAAVRLLKALGQEFNDHPFVDFIDLGLMGESGEWGELPVPTTVPPTTLRQQIYYFDDNWWHQHGGASQLGHQTLTNLRVTAVDARDLTDAMRQAFPDKRRMLSLRTMFRVFGVPPEDISRLQAWRSHNGGADVLPRGFSGFGWRQDNLGDWSEASNGSRVFAGSTMHQLQATYLKTVHETPQREAARGVRVGPPVDLSNEPVALEITKSLDQWPTADEVKLPLPNGGLWTYANTIAMTLDRALYWGASYCYLKSGSLPNIISPEAEASWRVFIKRLGYRLVCSSLQHPRSARLTDTLTIHTTWENHGVARCLGSFPGAWRVGIRLRPLFAGPGEVRVVTRACVDQIAPARRTTAAQYNDKRDLPTPPDVVTPDDYTPGQGQLDLDIRLDRYFRYLREGDWALDIGVVDPEGRALVRLATQGPPEGIEWWYPMSRIRLYT